MDKNKIVEDTSLLEIFKSEKDRKEYDILKMSNFFDIFIEKISIDINKYSGWEIYDDTSNLLGQIATAIKSGFDISKLGMLVADTSHFSQEIIDGLKNGLYHIGQSKEVAGNLRPAVLDSKGHLVKFITLKKAINPSLILDDISNLAMQNSLRQINAQIKDVGRNVKSIEDFVRRRYLNNKFLYAREKIMKAATANGTERKEFLKDADEYLMEGLVDLYADLEEEAIKLVKLNGAFRSLKEVDEILTRINEDMQMIPQYVGLRVYLLSYCGSTSDAYRVIDSYRYQLEMMCERKNGKYSIMEEIHRYYPYQEDNMDFWIEQPKQMISVLTSYEKFLMEKGIGIFYINIDEEVCVDE